MNTEIDEVAMTTLAAMVPSRLTEAFFNISVPGGLEIKPGISSPFLNSSVSELEVAGKVVLCAITLGQKKLNDKEPNKKAIFFMF